MPKEYIERELLMNRFEYYRSHNIPGGDLEKAYSIAKKEVAQAPAADVVEVRHGKWIVCKGQKLFSNEYYICSNCKSRNGVAIKFNYCFNCGARMDGAEQ